MKWELTKGLILVGIVALILIAAHQCSFAADWCESSGRAVLAKGARHATWKGMDGKRCWFAGRPRTAHHGASLPVYEHVDALVPLPRRKPFDLYYRQNIIEALFGSAGSLPVTVAAPTAAGSIHTPDGGYGELIALHPIVPAYSSRPPSREWPASTP